MVHNATLRLSVEITTSVLAALALLALTFSQLTIPLNLRKLDNLSQSCIRQSCRLPAVNRAPKEKEEVNHEKVCDSSDGCDSLNGHR
jgi:hypothetical protein